MSKSETPFGLRFFRLPAHPGKRDYKSKLHRETDTATLDAPSEWASGCVDQIERLACHADAQCVAFQAVVVGALQALRHVEQHERQAAAASISLAQREKLLEMAADLVAVQAALRHALRDRGAQMLGLGAAAAPAPADETSWWFALAEATQAAEESTERTASLVSGQPRGSAVRTLGTLVSRLLHRHHDALLAEADEWLS